MRLADRRNRAPIVPVRRGAQGGCADHAKPRPFQTGFPGCISRAACFRPGLTP